MDALKCGTSYVLDLFISKARSRIKQDMKLLGLNVLENK